MVTKLDITSAQKRLDRARDAMLSYAEGTEKDISTHTRLAKEVKDACDEFVKVVSELGK